MFLQSDHSFDLGKWNDEELWKAYLNGQQKALGGIFLRYYTRLYQYGMKLVKNEDVVKDGIQDLFLKLWKNRKTVDEAASVEFYLLLSLRRALLKLKKQSEVIRLRETKYMQIIPHSLQSIEQKIITQEFADERVKMLQTAMNALTKRQREIFYLRLQHGFTNKEISLILDLSQQRVKNHICEATKQLREQVYNSSVN